MRTQMPEKLPRRSAHQSPFLRESVGVARRARPVGRPARILRLVSVASVTGAYGGPFDTAQRQASLARQLGYNVRIVAGGFDGDAPASLGLHVAPVKHLLKLKSFSDVFSLRMLRLLVKAVRGADMVHISYSREPIPVVAVGLCRFFRVRTVLQPHGMLTSRASWAHMLIDFLIVRRAPSSSAAWLALTRREQVELESWNPKLRGHVRVVGNPPPLAADEVGTPERRLETAAVLFAARLHPRKRVLDFAEAASVACASGWTERYEVLGPDEGDLSELLAVTSDVPTLRYLGATDSAGVLVRLNEAAVFVLPAANEPWGNVLVAALTLGVPVVVTNSCALASEVAESDAGIVVPDRSPHEIAAAVHQLLSPANYSRIATNALRLGRERFSAATVAANLAALYSEVIPSTVPKPTPHADEQANAS
jgi:glycosyltransferase involved in cell wall biosynthesis